MVIRIIVEWSAWKLMGMNVGWRFSKCRAGTTTRYSWGDEWDSSKANNDDNDDSSTKPVGSFDYENEWGLKDMHGNVCEWCQDWYDAYPADATTDPTGPGSGSIRVTRGGGWYSDARYCRSANRSGRMPGNRYDILGFRLELDDSSSN